MGRPKKVDRTTEIEKIRDDAQAAERPDFYAAVKAEELLFRWDRWKLEQRLLRYKIQREAAEATLATERAKLARELAAAERKQREAEAIVADAAAQEALRKSGSQAPPEQYPGEFSPEKKAMGAGELVRKAAGGGSGDLR